MPNRWLYGIAYTLVFRIDQIINGYENRGANFFWDHAKAKTTLSNFEQGARHPNVDQGGVSRAALAWSLLDSPKREAAASPD